MAASSSSPEQVELKESANKLFAQKKYEDAIKEYTKALELGDNAVLFANRAFAWLKIDMYGAALEDSEKAVKIDPKYAKGFLLFLLHYILFLFCVSFLFILIFLFSW